MDQLHPLCDIGQGRDSEDTNGFDIAKAQIALHEELVSAVEIHNGRIDSVEDLPPFCSETTEFHVEV